MGKILDDHPYLDGHLDNKVFEFEDRKSDLGFNTSRFWWAWYNIERDIMYNQYGRIVGNKDYLIERGLMSEDFKIINNYEEPIKHDK